MQSIARHFTLMFRILAVYLLPLPFTRPQVNALTLTGPFSYFYRPDSLLHSDPADLGLSADSYHIRVDSQVTLHAWVFEPPVPNPPYTVIQFHGNAQNMSSHFRSLLPLMRARPECRFITFDYRGYGQSEGKPSPAATVNDGKKVMAWILRTFGMDTKLFVVGQSLGGAIAIPAAVGFSDNLAALFIDASFPSYRKIAALKLTEDGLPPVFAKSMAFLLSTKWDPDRYAHMLHGIPTVFAHARQDPVVPFSLGMELFEAGVNPSTGGGNPQWEFIPLPGSSHSQGLKAGIVMKRILLLLK